MEFKSNINALVKLSLENSANISSTSTPFAPIGGGNNKLILKDISPTSNRKLSKRKQEKLNAN